MYILVPYILLGKGLSVLLQYGIGQNCCKQTAAVEQKGLLPHLGNMQLHYVDRVLQYLLLQV